MPRLINSSKHIAFVKSAFPNDDHTAENAKVWFCVQTKDGDNLLHIEKKSNGRPEKFKTAKSITAYLTKLKLLPQDGWAVDKHMRICGGLIWKQEDVVHMTCAIKAQGGGKSMLKQSLNLGKKMGFPKFGEVNFVKVAERIREDEQLVGTVPVEASDSPIEAKIRKLHHQVERAAKRLPTEGKASDLNRLETLYRRIERYIDKKLWSRVSKLTPPLEGLSPATLATLQSQVTSLLEQAREAQLADGSDLAEVERGAEIDSKLFEAQQQQDRSDLTDILTSTKTQAAMSTLDAELQARPKPKKSSKPGPKPAKITQEAGSFDPKDAAFLAKLQRDARVVQGKLQIETDALAEKLNIIGSYARTKKLEVEPREQVDVGVMASRKGMAEVQHVNQQRIAKLAGKHQISTAEARKRLEKEGGLYHVKDVGRTKEFLDKKTKLEQKLKTQKLDMTAYQQKLNALYDGFKDVVIAEVAAKDEIKTEARILEKKGKYDDDFSEFTDIARSSLIFQTPKQLLNAKTAILNHLRSLDQRVVREKNRFSEPTDDGYSDFLLNVQDSHGHIFELQLHIEALADAKSDDLDADAWTAMLANPLFEQLKVSALTLIQAANAQQDHRGNEFQLPQKAYVSAQKIVLSDRNRCTGHDLYNVKRFIFEQDLGKGPYAHHVQLWAEAAEQFFYGPAASTIQDAHSEDFDALKTLTFM